MTYKYSNSMLKCLRRLKSTKQAVKPKNPYSKTVLLPRTTFPKWISGKDRVKTDELLAEAASWAQFYEAQKQDETKEKFVLHDGPPYANGDLHMGHAVNKVLKDILLRWKSLDGYRIDYVPGWDCHGLPIELKAKVQDGMSSAEIRKVARAKADDCVRLQKQSFEHWGVMGDWNNFYSTYSNNYVAREIELFWQLYQKGMVTRDFKPVYWSPENRTALAEAELIYNDKHVSPSVYVGLPVINKVGSIPDNCLVLVWTTTPWTLIANQAVCYREGVDYIVVRDARLDRYFIVAEPLKSQLEKVLDTELIFHSTVTDYLDKIEYKNPLNDRIGHFCPGVHVKLDTGTGLVHTAPGHGFDDFIIGLKYGLSSEPSVGEDGKYTDIAGPLLSGQNAIPEGNAIILEALGKYIVKSGEIVHSYPYDWRSRTPVLIRASMQWFMDTGLLKDGLLDSLGSVNVYPTSYSNSLSTFIKNRPFWCISRQRCWGTPIPVFYDVHTGSPVITQQSVNHLSKLFAEHGPDTWWTQSMDSLVSDDLKNRDLEMKREIFDIWMDSGVSWSTVLRHPQIADVYLEGTDQFSGWFQSSALLSYALRGKLPFKNLFVHSFVVDERGDKMSKSLGNVVSPKEVTHGGENFPVYGVDSLRWFVAYHSVNKSLIHFGPKIMQASAENVSKIRGVLKYLLGNLSDFNPSTDLVPLDRQLPVDQFQLYLLASFIKEARKHYDGYSFNQVCHSMLNYISNQLSSFYFLATKDRLYCDRADSLKRKSCQSTLYHCLQNLTSILSPILPHLAQEVYNHYPNCFKLSNGTSALHTWKLGRDTDWASSNSKGMEIALEYLEKVKVKQSEMKLKNFSVSIRCSQQAYDDLMCVNHTDYSAEECLNDILGSTNVTISVDPALLTPIISVEENKVQCCSRCWRFTITNGNLCLRCLDVVSNLVIK